MRGDAGKHTVLVAVTLGRTKKHTYKKGSKGKNSLETGNLLE